MSQVASSFPNVDLENFPKFKDASPYEVVLEAGDIIKVQSNVVSSIDVTLSYLEQT